MSHNSPSIGDVAEASPAINYCRQDQLPMATPHSYGNYHFFKPFIPSQDSYNKITALSEQHIRSNPSSVPPPLSRVCIIQEQKQSDANTINPADAAKDQEKEEEEEEDVTEDFVNEFNAHIGNAKKIKIARALIEKMCLLGGIIPGLQQQALDIPSARLGLSILARLHHPEHQAKALDNLLLLLQQDKIEKATATQLVSLAIQLMKHMNREWIQAEIVDVQVKLAHIYSLIAELLQRHYSKKHINGITKELKNELVATSKALRSLNTQQDPQLSYYVHLALEGMRRLADDCKELYDIIERFCHAIAGIASCQQGFGSEGVQEVIIAFKDLDPHILHAWYDGVLILNELTKKALTNFNYLTPIQVLLGKKGRVLNWKFTYGGISILSELTLKGESSQIRETAFQGIKALGPDFPGLASFADCGHLPLYRDLSMIAHLKKPRMKDPNIIIRQQCAEQLTKIAAESPDATIRKKAKLTLIRRLKLEKNKTILAYLQEIVPKTKQGQTAWIQEHQHQFSSQTAHSEAAAVRNPAHKQSAATASRQSHEQDNDGKAVTWV